MQFWLSHRGPVSVREQLVTQVMLGIVGNDLPAGTKLPSTRELARRLKIHANTVSAAYGELEARGWLEVRKGSGVYVRERNGPSEHSPLMDLEHQIATILRTARDSGLSLAEVQTRLEYWAKLKPPSRLLLVEPDHELGEIVMEEIRQLVRLPIELAAPTKLKKKAIGNAALLVLPSKAEQARMLLPPGAELMVLSIRSVPKNLVQWVPAQKDVLVAVVSRWQGFLDSARTMLLAAGFDDAAILLCDARKSTWRRGLDAANAVICDSASAKRLPKGATVIVFPLLSEAAAEELQKLERFLHA